MPDMQNLFYLLSFLTAVIAFLFALYLYLWVKKQKVENAEIIRVSRLIKEGAETFMTREYKLLGLFALCVSALILIILPKPIWQGSVLSNIKMVVSYLAGTVLSAIAGKIGIMVATLSNGRTAEAAERGRAAGTADGTGVRLPQRAHVLHKSKRYGYAEPSDRISASA